jgi:hypothetical protein
MRNETLTFAEAAARLDEIAPEHERTSCDDGNLANAYPNTEGYIRCLRCALLRADDPAYKGRDAVITIEVYTHIKVDKTAYATRGEQVDTAAIPDAEYREITVNAADLRGGDVLDGLVVRPMVDVRADGTVAYAHDPAHPDTVPVKREFPPGATVTVRRPFYLATI